VTRPRRSSQSHWYARAQKTQLDFPSMSTPLTTNTTGFSTSAAGKDVLDLEDLKARCLGNLALVERVLTKFADQLDRDLEQLEVAVQAGNGPAAAELAHRIKGIAASVSARSLFDDAATAEQRALDNEIGLLPEQLHRLRNDRSRLVESLERNGRPLK
jgi:HPt (histidine-containing phosphotransfer) domain-containing protein